MLENPSYSWQRVRVNVTDYPSNANPHMSRSVLGSPQNISYQDAPLLIAPAFIVFFDAILLKNVGDSPFSVRFCRILGTLSLLLYPDFS
jgi:hypothetical protein